MSQGGPNNYVVQKAATKQEEPMNPNDPPIHYVVGAGPYPYRADGRRMNNSEASSYLMYQHGMSILEAGQLLDMIATQAVRDAGTPHVEKDDDRYRINGSDPKIRSVANMILVNEWRLTLTEAAHTLDHAPQGRDGRNRSV